MFVHNNALLRCLFGAILLVALANVPAFAHQAEFTQPNAINSALVTATGTVAELTVRNQLTGVTLRYFGLKVDQGGSYALTGTGLDTLNDGSRINVTGTLAGNIFNVTLVSGVAPADSAARATLQAKTKKSVSGTLAVYHKDFFQQGRGEYGLAVRDASNKHTQLNVAAIPDSLEIGMLITADGTLAADGSSVDTTSIIILAPPAAMASDVAAAPVTNTVLVIPIRFSDTPASDPFNAAAINSEFQTHVGPYYQEVSYGQQSLNISVACTTIPVPAGCSGKTDANGWLQSTSPTPTGCGFDSMGTLADAVATAAGYDTSVTNTKFVYYVLPSIPACGWAGLAYVGYGHAWSNGYNALWVYGHELGHNFGLWHSGSVRCSGQALGGSCGVSEYGDPFDIMGNIRQMHFNAMQKSRLNWIPSTSVKTHASGTQTYQLSPIETGGQATYAVKIPTSNANRTYWIEYRQPVGVDAPLASLPNLGAQIRVSAPFESISGDDDTQIIDMTPATTSGGPNPGFDDAALLATAPPYIDSATGVTITVNSATPGPSGLLTVSVAMGGNTATTTTLSSSLNPSTVGASVTFTASVTGTAPTGTVAFRDGGSTITGCGAMALPAGAANSKIATCSTSSMSAGTHSIVATYSGDAANNSSTSATLSQGVNNAPSSTSLSSSANPANAGSTVTLTAAVTAAVPTGNVAFTEVGTALPGCGAVPVSGTIAVCNTSGLSIGAHSIVATFGGNATTAGSVSTALLQSINPAGETNVALASNGGIASASSTYTQSGSSFAAAAINNNERAGVNWGNGGGWIDATANSYPDWVEIDFNGSKTIDHVIVYTLQDNYASPVEPTDSMTFGLYGVTDFTVQGWNGASWVTLGTVSGNHLVKRTVNFTATTTDRIRINVTNALSSYARITEVEAWGVNAGPPSQINVALASNGGIASASSTYTATGYSFAAAAINNNERAGVNWGNGGGWIDATANSYPDWVEIDFNGSKTIDHVVVYSVQDNYASPVEPTNTMTFGLYGITNFTVQGWINNAWVTLGTVSGNNLVKRTVNFTATTTDRIRINVTNALSSYSRITEVEAWGVNAGPLQINVALASNGGIASASSTYTQSGSSFAAAAINNNERAGVNWGNGGGWIDATANAYPDWVEIDFNGSKSIGHVVVYSVQDNYASPVEPSDTMTFGLYGVTDFTVQGWNGASWVTLGAVSGNNLVKRTVNFTATTTNRIRINVTNALASFSRITEVEAWGN
jgi:hypothetical protein